MAINPSEIDGATLAATGAKAPKIKSPCDQCSPDGREKPHGRMPDDPDVPRGDEQFGFGLGLKSLRTLDTLDLV